MDLRWLFLFPLALPLAGGGDPHRELLEELNGLFHETYASAREAALARQGPVAVVWGDRLLLYRDRQVAAEAVIRPPRYHHLKAVSHVPLAVRLAALPLAGAPLDPARAAPLRKLRGRLAELPREPMLDASLGFLDRILARGAFSRQEVDAFSASLRLPLEEAMGEAAVLELEGLDAAVRAWGPQPPPGLRVVILGSHMAREGEITWQYFARLLGETREGDRIVYAEEKAGPGEALTLLAAHTVDGDLGRAFFGDPDRMHRDLLGDAARAWLDSHRPRR